MSDIDKWQLADAMNYVDPDYITEYESLSAFIANKKMLKRRRLRVATRIAACVAIVATGVLMTVKDINNGLIGRPVPKEEIQMHNTTRPIATEIGSKDGLEGTPGSNQGGGYASARCYFEQLQTSAPASEIGVSVFDVDEESLTLEFVYSDRQVKWYTWEEISIAEMDGDTVGKDIFHMSADSENYRLVYDADDKCIFRYRWGRSFGALPEGRYLITTYISDGNVKYSVNTLLVNEGY